MREIDTILINAILEKEKSLCPGALDMIAVYGSAYTGDLHDKSDLDLLILINNEEGYKLSKSFILSDLDIGYDLYCTTWDSLREDADCPHANLAKLCDSQIHYARNIDVVRDYMALRQGAKEMLSSSKRFEQVEEIKKGLKLHFAEAILCEELGDMRALAAEVIFDAFDLVMLFNGRYFKKGIKRAFGEMEDLLKPSGFSDMVLDLVRAKDLDGLKEALIRFVRSMLAFYEEKKEKEAPCPGNISGSYEEMYSNWRNKAYEAAKKEDVFSSFMSLACMSLMWKDIALDVTLPEISVLADFDPDDLIKNAALYDQALSAYLSVYEEAGVKVTVYENVDAFLDAYLEQ